MNKNIIIILIMTLLTVVGVSAYSNTCDGGLLWLNDTAIVTINNTQSYTTQYYPYNNLTNFTNKDGWERTGSLSYAGENFTIYNDSQMGLAFNFTYNFTSAGASFRSIIKNSVAEINASHYSGIGFWIKGDGLSNSSPVMREIKIVNNQTGGAVSNLAYYYGTTVNNKVYLTPQWQYVYIDFSRVLNVSSSTTFFESWKREHFMGLRISIFNDAPARNEGSVYIANISLVDLDKGSNYYERWRDNSQMGEMGRNQESIYGLAYQYNLTGNTTMLDYAVMQGDWLVQHQLKDGGWANAHGQLYTDYSSLGMPLESFMKAYLLIKNTSVMQENVSLFSNYNNTFISGTRAYVWNISLDMAKDKAIGSSFPVSPSYVTNQYLSALHGAWLYCNDISDSTCLNTINTHLQVINSTSSINYFGFSPEFDTYPSSTTIGYSNEYHGLTQIIASSFYLDSNNTILRDILIKYGNSAINRFNLYNSLYINNSRGINTSYEARYFQVYKTADLINNNYLKQAVYNYQNYSSIWESSNKRTGIHWTIDSIKTCTDNGYSALNSSNVIFPQNYTHFVYNTYNSTNASVRKAIIGSNGYISNITSLEFPIIKAYWDSQMTFTTTSNNLDVIGNNTNINFTANEITNISFFNFPVIYNDIRYSNGSLIAINQVNYNLTLLAGESVEVGSFVPNFNYSNGRYPVVSDDVVLYYHFNNDTDYGENSTLVYDFSGKGNNGTTVNSPIFNSTYGIELDGGYVFNGIDQWINATGTEHMISNNSNFTTCGYINIASNKNYNNFFGKTNDAVGGASATDWGIFGTTGAISATVSNGTATKTVNLLTSPLVNHDYWVCISYNGTALKGYLNGVNTATTDTSTLGGGVTNAQTFKVGYSANSARRGNFTADEILVWNTTKTGSQIWSIYTDYYGGCLTPYEDIAIGSGYTKICDGSYNLNDSNSNGAIQLNSNDIYLNLTNVNLTGNLGSTSRAIQIVSRNNVTIIGGTFDKYYFGIRADASTASINNLNILSNYFTSNMSNFDVYVASKTSDVYIITNLTVMYNTFNVSGSTGSGFEIFNGATYNNFSSIFIKNNIFDSVQGCLKPGIKLTGTSGMVDSQISDNYFYGGNVALSASLAIYIFSTKNLTINNNTITKSQYPIAWSTGRVLDSWIIDNYIFNTDEGIMIANANGTLYLENNTLMNQTKNYDTYDSAIKLFNTTGVTIRGNNISEFGSTGIQSQMSSNILIENNIFTGILASDRINYVANDLYDPYGAIKFIPLYKSFVGGGLEPYYPAYIANTSVLVTTNSVIRNNTFNNVQIMLWGQGMVNVSNDFTDYWYRRFQAPSELINTSEFYIQNSYSELYRYSGGLSYVLAQGYNGNYLINYSVSKNIMNFTNMNSSVKNISFFNLSYPFNDIKNSSNGVILYSNTDEVNITLLPNQSINVGAFYVVPITNVTVLPASTVYYDTILTCNGTVPAGEVENGSSYKWFINNATIAGQTSNILPANLGFGNGNYYITCEYTLSDGYVNATAVNSTAKYVTPKVVDSGSGGGGSGGTITNPVQVSIYPMLINTTLPKDTLIMKNIYIENIEDNKPINVLLTTNFTGVTNKNFTIQPGVIHNITFYIDGHKNYGTYNEYIFINVSNGYSTKQYNVSVQYTVADKQTNNIVLNNQWGLSNNTTQKIYDVYNDIVSSDLKSNPWFYAISVCVLVIIIILFYELSKHKN